MRNRVLLLGFALLVAVTFGLPTLQSQSVPLPDNSPKQKSGAQDAEASKAPVNRAYANTQADERLKLQTRLVILTVTVTDANGRVITRLGVFCRSGYPGFEN